MRHAKTHQKLAHELVADTAKGVAGAFYELAASESDDFYKMYPKEKDFIKKEWPRFIDVAKKQLSAMLGMAHIDENQKAQIFEALIKHASLPGNIDKRVASHMIAEGDVPSIH